MALGDLYLTRTELKQRLGITDSQDDQRVDQAIAAASSDIELYCNRQFNDAGTASERKFYADSPDVVLVDDFWTVTGLVVKAVAVARGGTETTTTLTSTEYRVEPLERTKEGRISWPYWQIRNLRSTMLPVPGAITDTDEGLGYMKITARWGWETVPKAVKEACYILGEEYYKLKDAPFGVMNWNEFGPMRVTENRSARGLLTKYARGRIRLGD